MAEDIEKERDSSLGDAEAKTEASPEATAMAAKLGDLISGAEIEWALEASGVDIEEAPVVELASEIAALDDDDNIGSEPSEFIDSDHAISIIESLLFSTDKPISMATIKQVFKGSNVRTRDISRALDTLASDYAGSQRGVCIEEINGGFQLRTKYDNASYLRRLAKTRPFKLSGPALEVLSIIAYKQPLIKSEIDEIRGVESGHLLRALMERSLVLFAGKSELPGKPTQYGTTRKFLEIFGLRNLKELPTLSEIDELLPEGIGAEDEKKETLSDLTGELSTRVGSTYSEGEDELGKITDQLQNINVSSEFFEQEKIRQREKRDGDRAQNIREAMAVGEAVETRDQKWLERYEAKLQADTISASAVFEAKGGVEGEIEAEAAHDSGPDDRDEFEDVGDLEAQSDYNDEAEV